MERRRFTALERRTLSEEIRAQLQRSIEDGSFPPGSQLASERELCAEFGVARTSVREAIQGLLSLGLVERRGNRTFVVEGVPDVRIERSNGQKLRVRELFEVRRLLELPMVELACCRASDAERSEILGLADQFQPGLSVADFRQLDRAFHSALARAGHNALLTEIYGKVLDALFGSEEFEAMLGAPKNAEAVAALVTQSGIEHRAIAAALASGEPVAVVEEMEQHLGGVEEKLLRQLV